MSNMSNALLVSTLLLLSHCLTGALAFNVYLHRTALGQSIPSSPSGAAVARELDFSRSSTKGLHVPTGDESIPGLFQNQEGLELIKLVHPGTGASAEVYLFGGVVTSYKDGDGTEFLALRKDTTLDGSKPIAGGLPHCWPQFGPGKLQQHGFARNVHWALASFSDKMAILELRPSDYTKMMWDKEFLCRYSVQLETDGLKTRMEVHNVGSQGSFDFQAAQHTYLSISSLENVQINGSFSGKKFYNKLLGEFETESRDVIVIDEPYDRVYKGVNDPIVKDTGTGKQISLVNAAGWEDTVIWNPYGDDSMGYEDFVCVESVKFDPVTLLPGDSWEGILVLCPEQL